MDDAAHPTSIEAQGAEPAAADASEAAPSVLVFDSGVGGLSVLGEIARALPAARLVYAMDDAGFPYGTRTEGELLARLPDLLCDLVARSDPDIAVIACNTASTIALPALRTRLAIPVVGTVPAIKPAAEASRSRVIGLLGTPGTVRRGYTQGLIDEFAGDCTVFRHGSAELVALAEAKLRGAAVDPAAVAEAVAGLFAQPGSDEIDVVVLACTHFPLLGPELAAATAASIRWVDSGAAIARRAAALLQDNPGRRPYREPRAILTGGRAVEPALARALRSFGLREVAGA